MDFVNGITKKIDLVANDGLSSFMNMAAQQNHNVYKVFYDFISEVKPKRILEIGTALGGFTQFLNEISKELEQPFNIRTYDIHYQNWYEDMKNQGIDVRVENVFSYDYKEVDNDVIDFINGDGITLVLCDGGNKVGEFNILSNYLKQGDFIMAHDYIDTYENFKENYFEKVWNWHEIAENNISEACERNSLIDYNKEIFNSVVWVCKVKN